MTSKENLGKRKTNGVTEFIEVLVLPLCFSIHNFVVNILAVDNKIMLNVEDEIPRVSECLRHLAELVKISADGSLALLKLVSNVMDNVSKVLNGVENRVE